MNSKKIQLLSVVVPLFVFLGAITCSAAFEPRFQHTSASFSPRKLAFPIQNHGHTRLVMAKVVDEKDAPPCLLVSVQEKLGVDVNLVLASQSPRRREILDMMGLSGKYTVEPSPLDESILQAELIQQKVPSKDYTLRLAEAKAEALAKLHMKEDNYLSTTTILYLGSDTIVEIDEGILEKPKNTTEAKEMLQRLSGRQHSVHTGVALYRLENTTSKPVLSLVDSFTETASVTFCHLTPEDIDAYVATGEPLDKAGSYGIQGIGGQMVTQLEGDYFCVMGLPMHKTSRLIAQALHHQQQKIEE